MRRIALACLATALAFPAIAADYPVSGRFGVGAFADPGPVDCTDLRVVSFSGDQRRDTNGGVPAYRNRSIVRSGAHDFEVVDEFTTGQISNAQAIYTLRILDANRIELDLQPGGVLKLQRCK
jgi:hypothetical protein